MNYITKYGNMLDVRDSIFLSSVGEGTFTNAALSFYNHSSHFGITYFVDTNKIVFQNDFTTDYNYWDEAQVSKMENRLETFIYDNINPDEELCFDFDGVVNYILQEMDFYTMYNSMKGQ